MRITPYCRCLLTSPTASAPLRQECCCVHENMRPQCVIEFPLVANKKPRLLLAALVRFFCLHPGAATRSERTGYTDAGFQRRRGGRVMLSAHLPPARDSVGQAPIPKTAFTLALCKPGRPEV